MKNMRLGFSSVLLLVVAVAVAGLHWGPALGQVQVKEKGKPAIVKFEYKVVTNQSKNRSKDNDIEDSLNKLGEEGWEFVGSFSGGTFPGGGATITNMSMILKRPKS